MAGSAAVPACGSMTDERNERAGRAGKGTAGLKINQESDGPIAVGVDTVLSVKSFEKETEEVTPPPARPANTGQAVYQASQG